MKNKLLANCPVEGFFFSPASGKLHVIPAVRDKGRGSWTKSNYFDRSQLFPFIMAVILPLCTQYVSVLAGNVSF